MSSEKENSKNLCELFDLREIEKIFAKEKPNKISHNVVFRRFEKMEVYDEKDNIIDVP